ncbi:transglutaminase-like domain-containing protein [Paenibacillus sp. PSB04]|uniref:transglutaminase-like domain-containing protein n=1 Tax=Paenibacillus sp. PSB04 TaxID=2866810 RepID=UPI0021F11D76|nr:transglutaminase-like domain-containing protein [Paenibacillus sp. PSB04]UYO06309.1 transglutaminase-like domain-containing protein [Paenibacillus sp. PSB04]
MEERTDPLLYRLIISLPFMGLFAEWLIPLRPLTGSADDGFMTTLLWLTALLLLWGTLLARWTLTLPVYFLLVGAAWYSVSGEGQPFSWLISWISQCRDDILLLLSTGHFAETSSETRTLVLIVGWSLLVYSVQSLALSRRSIFLFAAATLLYLICLETLLGIHIYADMIRTCGLLLLLQGMLHLSGLRESDTSGRFGGKVYGTWIVSLSLLSLLVLGGSWGLGYAAEAKPPGRLSLEQAAGRLESWIRDNYGDASATAVTGYNLSGDDQDMGMPLSQGGRLYFEAESPVPTYWRGETLSLYDGRKWAGQEADSRTLFIPGAVRPEGSDPEAEEPAAPMAEYRTVTQQIMFSRPMTESFPLFAGGPIAEVLDLESSRKSVSLTVIADEDAGTVKVPLISGVPEVNGYRIKADIPAVDPQVLREEKGADPARVKDEYLQLPDKLPERVKQLADRITSASLTRYDAVVAVEDYLKTYYAYTMDTRVPPQGEDFVDDFLFTTRKGYCNHFSTAMAVLLRSEGIPTRYVRGFAPGKEDSSHPGRYQISEGDAHAWVEVYFPGSGWIPFDPTPGFALPSDSGTVQAQDVHSGGTWDWVRAALQLKNITLGIASFIAKHAWIAVGAAATALLLAAAVRCVWMYRGLIWLWCLVYLSRRTFPGKEQLLRAALPAWKGITRRYGAAPPGATVREYVQSLQVDDEMMRKEMYDFVAEWEKIAYGQVPVSRSQGSAFLRRCLLIAGRLA